MTRGTFAFALALLDMVGAVLLGAWGLLSPGSSLMDSASVVLILAAVTVFSLMGALLVRRAPANRIGALLLATATAQVVGIGLQGYWIAGSAAVPPWPAAAIASAMTDVWYIAPFVIALVGIPLVFPDGRLPSPRFRVVAWATVAGMVLQARMVVAVVLPGSEALDAVIGFLNVVSVLALIVGFGGAMVAIWVRFRGGDHVQRQQVKWLLLVAGVAAVAFPVAMVLGASSDLADLAAWAVAFAAYLALPVAIGIAVLRYHLYDIDRLISRTIGYAVVTVTLAAVFVGGILVFEAVLAPVTGGNTLGIAASTLIVAALFGPLRRRVHRVVDRRFNRARFDAERALAAFVAQLRNDVDLESVSADVLGVVSRTVAPATVGLWIRQPEADA